MKKPLFTALCTFLVICVYGQQFRLASYNTLRYSPSNIDGRHSDYRLILNEIDPDILVLEELSGRPSAKMFLDSILNFTGNLWDTASFIDSYDLDIALCFKSSKFTFLNTVSYPTALRDIYHFTLKPINSSDTLHVFAVHLKASTGSANQNQRADEADTLRKYTNLLPFGSYFVVCGDFNLYGSTEPAYTKMLANTTGNDGHFIDQVSLSGSWNNASYAAHHTQSPRSTQFGGGASGGMDDRFDLILMSRAIDSAGGISYVPNSLTPFGNDGQHYNLGINDLPVNSAVSALMANALHDASDHLPVFADFSYDTVSTPPVGGVTLDTILLAEYDRENNTSGSCVASVVKTYSATNTSATELCRTGVVANTGGDFNSRNWAMSSTYDAGLYYSFSISPDAGSLIHLTQLKIRLDRSNTGPAQVAIRCSMDNFSTDISSIAGLNTSGETFEINLDINGSDPVEFRVYGFEASSSAGTMDVEPFAGEELASPGIALYGYLTPEVIWDGVTWNTGASPSGDLAEGTIIIKKGSKALIDNSISKVKNIIIEPGALLEVSSLQSVVVSDTVFIQSDVANGSGSLKGDVSGALSYKMNVIGNAARWFSLAMPANASLINLDLGGVPINTLANSLASQVNVWYYDAQNIDGTTNEGVWSPVEDKFKTSDLGYSVFLGEPGFGSFPIDYTLLGDLRSSISIPVYLNNSVPVTNQGWNLIPNPFPAVIDWVALTSDNISLNATYYIDSANTWKFHNGVTGNASPYIQAGQSFFVKTASTGSVDFTQEHLTLDFTSQLYKTSLPEIEIVVDNGVRKDQSYIVFDQTLGFDFDDAFDGRKRMNKGSNALNMYTVDSLGVNYAINGLPLKASKQLFPLKIESQIDTLVNLKFNLKNFSNPLSLINYGLMDTTAVVNGLTVPLNIYNGVNHFAILLNANNSVGLERPSDYDFEILNMPSAIRIRNNFQGKANVELFDLFGRKLRSETIDTGITDLDLNSGAYIVRVYSGGKEVSKLCLIK